MEVDPDNKIVASPAKLGTKTNDNKTKDFKKKIVNYFKNKLEKLPIKKDNKDNIIGFAEVKKNIEDFIDKKYEKSLFLVLYLLHGQKKYDKIDLEELTLTNSRPNKGNFITTPLVF